MTDYIFETERNPVRSVYAEFDPVGGAIIIYLREFSDIFEDLYPHGDMYESILQSFCVCLFDHEEIHAAISECTDVLGGQEHEGAMAMIKEWMDKPLY